MQRRSEEDLWDLVDRGDQAELASYLEHFPEDRERVAGLRTVVDGVREVLAGPAGTAAESAPLETLPASIGEFEITGLLGQGGMGLVYSARQAEPQRAVALKVIRRGLVDEARADELFRREVATLARLEHPDIARIYAAGRTDDGQAWLAMELVKGLALDHFVKQRRPDRRARLELFERIVRAVHFAHERGVVHRDLKPQNVLVDDEQGPHVLDFGLARVVGDEASLVVSQAGEGLIGTLAYMSPEQARGESAVDERSDVYSLGAMLYELLSGKRPHDLEGVTLFEAIRRISERDPVRLARVGRGLAGDLEAVVHKALERNRNRRYASAAELADEVRRHLDGKPVLASRPTWRRRAARLLLRHWLITALTLLLLLMTTTALVASLGHTRLWREITGDWVTVSSPFEGLRWRGDVPEVEVEGRWWELVAIDEIDGAFLVGSAKQFAGERWRKRFSEDLVQLLHRCGSFALWEVDLTVRDLVTREVVIFSDVSMTQDKRQAIYRERYTWPFLVTSVTADERVFVRLSGTRDLELVTLDGFPAELFCQQIRQQRIERRALQGRPLPGGRVEISAKDFDDLYDVYCSVVGRSPGDQLRLELRDVATGKLFDSEEPRVVPR